MGGAEQTWSGKGGSRSGGLAEEPRLLIEELGQLIAAAPTEVSLAGVTVRGEEILLTLGLPRALLGRIAGLAGTAQAPYLVRVRAVRTSASQGTQHTSQQGHNTGR